MDELTPQEHDLNKLWQELDSEFGKLWRELDRAFGNFFRSIQLPDFGQLGQGVWTEPEFREEGHELVVRLRVPGARPDSLEATLTADQLLVRGEATHKQTAPPGAGGAVLNGSYVQSYTCFARAFPLPKRVRPEGARTEEQNGCLVVRAPLA